MHRQIKIEVRKIWLKGYVNRSLAGCQGVTRPYPRQPRHYRSWSNMAMTDSVG
jgi:hypothetical protein